MFDTITAIATAPGVGAIGIVRVSGPDALRIAGAAFTETSGLEVAQFSPRCLYYGALKDASDNVIDRCLLTISRAPNSYTGEDTAEFQCHGAPVVLQSCVMALCHHGARLARAGEFTKRAFLNGKLDLIQAEAVIDLIHAETVEAAKNAVGQLGGAVSDQTDQMYHGLADILAHFHAVLDYPDEEIEPFALADYAGRLAEYETTLVRLQDTFRRGAFLTNGVPTAIIGRPNAGKSSLLNALLGYDRAIVTEIPGTTRDTLEERMAIGGVLLRMTDTAGIRETADPIEREGVRRSKIAACEADLVLAVFDSSAPRSSEDEEVIARARDAAHVVVIANKSDLAQALDTSGFDAAWPVVSVSTKTGDGLDALEREITRIYTGTPVPPGRVLTNPRHVDAVGRALAYIRSAMEAMHTGITPDAVLTELEGAMESLGELSGKTVREDVVGRIFERFCVGK